MEFIKTWTFVFLLCLVGGCATARPTIQIELKGAVEEKKPEYSITISM